MSPTFKMLSRKGIHIKTTLTAETPFSFFIPVNNKSSQFYALNTQRIIYESFGISGSYLVT